MPSINLLTPQSAANQQIHAALDSNRRGGEPAPDQEEPSFTSEQAAERLTKSGHQWRDSNRNGKTELSYEFLRSAPNDFDAMKKEYQDPLKINGFSAFSPAQKALAARTQQAWSDVANVSFTPKRGGAEGHLTYANYDTGSEQTDIKGFAFKPDPLDPAFQGSIWINKTGASDKNADLPTLNSDARLTLLHETGHALGLDHPVDDPEQDVDYQENWASHSVMSYNHPLFCRGSNGLSVCVRTNDG